MSKEVIITNYKNQYLVVSLDNGKAVEMFLKAPDALKIGDIFVGKVKNIVNNIQAAFVEIDVYKRQALIRFNLINRGFCK